MIKQVIIQDIKKGDKVWDAHTESWREVSDNFETGHVYRVIHFGTSGTIRAEYGHPMFVQYESNLVEINNNHLSIKAGMKYHVEVVGGRIHCDLYQNDQAIGQMWPGTPDTLIMQVRP